MNRFWTFFCGILLFPYFVVAGTYAAYKCYFEDNRNIEIEIEMINEEFEKMERDENGQ